MNVFCLLHGSIELEWRANLKKKPTILLPPHSIVQHMHGSLLNQKETDTQSLFVDWLPAPFFGRSERSGPERIKCWIAVSTWGNDQLPVPGWAFLGLESLARLIWFSYLAIDDVVRAFSSCWWLCVLQVVEICVDFNCSFLLSLVFRFISGVPLFWMGSASGGKDTLTWTGSRGWDA